MLQDWNAVEWMQREMRGRAHLGLKVAKGVRHALVREDKADDVDIRAARKSKHDRVGDVGQVHEQSPIAARNHFLQSSDRSFAGRRPTSKLCLARNARPYSNSFTGPLMAFHAKCPPDMYRASN